MIKLSQGQKAGLLFGGAILAGLLIVGRADRKLKGYFNTKKRPSKLPPSPYGIKRDGDPPAKEVGEISGAAASIPIPCDPLLAPKSPCHVCTARADGKLYLQTKAGCEGVPAIKPWEIGVSIDYDEYKIGDHWAINILYPFLDKERQEGRLAVYDHDAGEISEMLWDDPRSFINETFGWDNPNDEWKSFAAIFIAASLAMSPAKWVKRIPFTKKSWLSGTKLSSAIRQSASGAAKLTRAAFLAELGSDGYQELTEYLGYPNVPHYSKGSTQSGPGLVYNPQTKSYEYSDQYLGILPASLGDLLTSANEALLKLLTIQEVIVGQTVRKTVLLGDLEVGGHIKMQEMVGEIFYEIFEFQRRHFEWPSSGNIFSWLYD